MPGGAQGPAPRGVGAGRPEEAPRREMVDTISATRQWGWKGKAFLGPWIDPWKTVTRVKEKEEPAKDMEKE